MKPIRFTAIVSRTALAAALAAVLVVVTSAANATGMNASWHKGKSGTLKITAPIKVGGVLLEPGTYEVKARYIRGRSVVEFARWNYNPSAPESLPVWDREVVATVDALPQTLSTAATRTELLLASAASNKAVALEIRGHSVDYVF